MPTTRSGLMYGMESERPATMTALDVVAHAGNVLGQGKQEAGKMRKHWVYSAADRSLVVVSIRKNQWGLVLVHADGRVQQGQFVGRHKFHHQHSAFDGTHFYWDVWHAPRSCFMIGKSVAPYWTAVEPALDFTGWYRRYWRYRHGVGAEAVFDVSSVCGLTAGGGVGVMHDLSGLEWKRLAPPAGYPDARAQ
jgi:hypothetical protein